MPRNPAALPLLFLLWIRLRRAIARFTALAGRVRAGTLPRRRTPTPPPARPPRPRERLPEGFAWLVRLVPEAAAFGSQLHHLLCQPEMAALLAAAPQAGRILRPLCRMLGTPPTPALPPPSPPRPSRPAAVRATAATAAAERPRGRTPNLRKSRAAGLTSFRLYRRLAPA